MIIISERNRLISRLLKNVFLDTCIYSVFGTVVGVTYILGNIDFLEYRKDAIPEILKKFIVAENINNMAYSLIIAFSITFFFVFIKHTNNITADSSNLLIRKIKELNDRTAQNPRNRH